MNFTQDEATRAVAFVRRMAQLTTLKEEWEDPDRDHQKSYHDFEDFQASISDDRLCDEFAAFQRLIQQARAIVFAPKLTHQVIVTAIDHAKHEGSSTLNDFYDCECEGLDFIHYLPELDTDNGIICAKCKTHAQDAPSSMRGEVLTAFRSNRIHCANYSTAKDISK